MTHRHDARPADGCGRKATLVCPNCDRESGVDGDWTVTERRRDGEARVRISCPDCGALVVSQPAFGIPA